jgi:glutamyl aminopeptidase
LKRLELLKKLTTTPGISGHETLIKEIMTNELGSTTSYNSDNLGSVFFNYKGNGTPKIMFIAHMDEIGFIVADILESGFLKLQPIGGWNPNTLLSSPVEVITSNGEKHPGIIGSVPVHFSKGKNAKLDIYNMFVDIGAMSKDDVLNNYNVNLGDQVVPITNYYFNEQNKRMFSKAFDDRAGVAAVIEVGKFLSENEHPNQVYCVGSVQEEVGCRGAQSISNYTDADVCFVLEGAPADDTPGIPSNSQTSVGKGVHIRMYDPTMIVKRELKDFVIKIAEQNEITHQLTVRRGGGTDGKHLHLANRGIPTIVLGVPVRYAHSHNCSISMKDFDELIKLLTALVKNLDEEALNKILK